MFLKSITRPLESDKRPSSKICNNKFVSFEVFADDYFNMKKQALQINTWGKNVYVKIQVVNSKGVFMGKIIKELNNKNIKLYEVM